MHSIRRLLSVALFLLAVTPAFACAQSQQPFDLQVGLGGLAYYTTQVPFKDLMAQSNKWIPAGHPYGSTCNPVAVDEDGYPTQSLTGRNCLYYNWLMLHIPSPPPGAPYKWPSGHYVLTYMGTGTISVTLSSVARNQTNVAPGRIEFDVPNPGDLFPISILNTDPADHLRNFHVFLASDEFTYKTQPFRQEFLNQLAPYKILRFMDWSGVSLNVIAEKGAAIYDVVSQPDPKTMVLSSAASSMNNAYKDMIVGHSFIDSYDGATRTLRLASPVAATSRVTIYEFLNRTWDTRAKTTIHTQKDAGGIAYEYMVQLCNLLNKDMWINVPTAANDDYIRNLALYLKANLNPNLKIYIEYSNETWNFSYPGYSYSWAMTQKYSIPGSMWVGGDQWHPYRAVEIFRIFNQVFGQEDLRVNRTSGDRLVRVLATQTAWLDRAKKQLDWMMPNNAAPTFGHKAYEYADAWGVTAYFALPSTVTGDVSANLASISNDELIALQKQAILEKVAPTGAQNWLYASAQEARARGLKLVQYEGGNHFLVPNGDAATVTKITNLMRDPRMEDVHAEAIQQWANLAQQFPGTIGAMSQFVDVSSYSKWGFWGALESVFQNPADVPRYRAFLKYANGTLALPTSSAGTTVPTSSQDKASTTSATTTSGQTGGQNQQTTQNQQTGQTPIEQTPGVTTPSPVSTVGLPERKIQQLIILAVYLNPSLTCTQLSFVGTALQACEEYKSAQNQYNWIGVDWDPLATVTGAASTSSPAQTAPPAYTFTRGLSIGSRGADVTALQELLKYKGYFSGDVSMYFGSVTSRAVAAYQRASNLEPVGRVGPKTLAMLNGQPASATSAVSSTAQSSYARTSSEPVCLAIPGSGITHNLAVGTCTSEVQILQRMLNSLGFYVARQGGGSPGREIMRYGPGTEAAVVKFQKAYGITTDQHGVVGPATRKKLAELTNGTVF